MAEIPSYDQWMKETHSLTHPRSEFLKKVDEALKAFHQSRSALARSQVKVALDRWRFEQSKAGKDWRKSVRNASGAVTALHRALVDLDGRKLTPEELEALKYIARSQAMALQKQFAGAKVQFKSSTLVGMTGNAATKWQRFKTGASSAVTGGLKARTAVNAGRNLANAIGGVRAAAGGAADSGPIRKAIGDFCRELCPGVDASEVFRNLNLGSIDSFAADLAPFVGAISSGGKAILGWIGVARTAWAGIKIADARGAIAAGDPEAAFDALLVILDREIKSQSVRAGVNTAAFAGKALGAFADAGAVTGPVIGLLELLADIFQTIVEYVRDYRECQAGNEALKVGALNFDLFTLCPILGCYFLVVQDHSTIINFAVGDYGTTNWVFDVERMVKKIEPVLSRAQQYINSGRLEVPQMSRAKGVVAANYSVATGVAKVTGAPGALKDAIANRIDAWFEKPEKPPAVIKSRIVGFGSN